MTTKYTNFPWHMYNSYMCTILYSILQWSSTLMKYLNRRQRHKILPVMSRQGIFHYISLYCTISHWKRWRQKDEARGKTTNLPVSFVEMELNNERLKNLIHNFSNDFVTIWLISQTMLAALLFPLGTLFLVAYSFAKFYTLK